MLTMLPSKAAKSDSVRSVSASCTETSATASPAVAVSTWLKRCRAGFQGTQAVYQNHEIRVVTSNRPVISVEVARLQCVK